MVWQLTVGGIEAPDSLFEKGLQLSCLDSGAVSVASIARLLACLEAAQNVVVQILSGNPKGLCSHLCRHLECKLPMRFAVSSMT